MKIKLLDAKEYAKLEGKEFNRGSQFGIYISGGNWCPCSSLKCLPNGEVVARISNELVSTGLYNCCEKTIDEGSRLYSCIRYWVNRFQNIE